MRTVIQRVSEASLVADGEPRAEIGRGVVALLGIAKGDTDTDLAWTVRKLAELRIFPDEQDRMNLSAEDEGLEVLLVPNFTVAGETKKGRRPGFDTAMAPGEAAGMFERVAVALGERVRVQTGVFGAHMDVMLVNDGPVTLVIDSRA